MKCTFCDEEIGPGHMERAHADGEAHVFCSGKCKREFLKKLKKKKLKKKAKKRKTAKKKKRK